MGGEGRVGKHRSFCDFMGEHKFNPTEWCFQGWYLDLFRDITGLSFLSPMPSRNTKAEMALD